MKGLEGRCLRHRRPGTAHLINGLLDARKDAPR